MHGGTSGELAATDYDPTDSNELSASMHGLSSALGAAPGSTLSSIKTQLTIRMNQSKLIVDELVNLFYKLFHNVCDDAQSLVEISAATKQHRMQRQQQWGWRSSQGDVLHGNSFSATSPGNLLMWRFADSISSMLESYCLATRVAGCAPANASADVDRSGGEYAIGSDNCEIYKELDMMVSVGDAGNSDAVSDSDSDRSERSSGLRSRSNRSRANGASKTGRRSKRSRQNSTDDKSLRRKQRNRQALAQFSTNANLVSIAALLSAHVLAKVIPSMLQQMEASLRAFGMSSASSGNAGAGIRERVTSRISLASHMLLLAFVENRWENLC
jgi:hypothetical protein